MKNVLKYFLVFLIFSSLLSCAVYDNGVKVYVFKDLKEALKTPEKVTHLKLIKKKYTKFPLGILKFTNLKSLDLSKNELDSIPKEISQLINLEVLKLNKNNFIWFPLEICTLNSLEELSLNNNELENIPKEIVNLDNLIKLDLWSNNITKFPEELTQLVKLKTLDLRMIEIPEKKQYELKEMLPQVKVYMSNSCNCAP